MADPTAARRGTATPLFAGDDGPHVGHDVPAILAARHMGCNGRHVHRREHRRQGARIFSAGFVGYSTAAGAIGSLLSPVVVGFLSDRYFAAQRLLAVMHVGCAVAAWGMYRKPNQVVFFLWLFVYFQCFSPGGGAHEQDRPPAPGQYRRGVSAGPHLRHGGLDQRRACSWVSSGRWATGESIEATRIPLMLGACGSC